MKNMKIGIQLYTVRDPLAQDFKGVLRELKKIGFDGVEFAWNFGGMEPLEIAAFMKETGLSTAGIHFAPQALADPNDKIYEYARALNAKYLTFSICGDFKLLLDSGVESCSAAGKAAWKNGFQFTYHNHAAEFVKINGVHALDLLYNKTNAAEVMAELDVCWITKGGENPVAYIQKYAQRVPQIHMKDMEKESGDFTELGRGCVNLSGSVEAARNTICEWLIYEQDICKINPLESSAISFSYLKKIGF